MKILLSGSSGLIGSHIISNFDKKKYHLIRLVRNDKDISDDTIFWNPSKGALDKSKLNGLDVVIHLAGENISSARWTRKQKEKITNSRVNTTSLLAKTLIELKESPKLFICASATGYYGNRNDELLDEESTPGEGFLADVCKKWEAAANPVRKARIRTIHLRFGVVLSNKGGAFKKMLSPFKLGIGGIFGNGQQYMPWITIDDILGILEHVIQNKNITGSINVVTPNPIINSQYTKLLGELLSRPTILRIPAISLKILLGQMADELLLSSARVIPKKLIESGYQFKFPEIKSALVHLLTAGTR
jgi:uncharacterized protein (TIGR01777 family)